MEIPILADIIKKWSIPNPQGEVYTIYNINIYSQRNIAIGVGSTTAVMYEVSPCMDSRRKGHETWSMT